MAVGAGVGLVVSGAGVVVVGASVLSGIGGWFLGKKAEKNSKKSIENV